jgi:hypothetical protein
MTEQSEGHRAAVNHHRVVRASARVLAYRRWNRDDEGSTVFQQLVLWLTGTDGGEEPATAEEPTEPGVAEKTGPSELG